MHSVRYPLGGTVSDNVVPKVNVRGSLVGCQIAAHMSVSLLVHERMGRTSYMFKLVDETVEVQPVLACV